MVRMLAPEGVTQVSVEQQNFQVDKEGFVTVPEPFIPKLRDIGFKTGPFVAEVSAETADAIKAAAAAADAAKVSAETADAAAKADAAKPQARPVAGNKTT